jgi:DNA-binding SARP family transcriptional activator
MSTPSSILTILKRGEYAAALEAFQALEQPTPEDQCWAGLCLAHLGQPVAATERLIIAKAQGFAEAGPVLAAVYRSMGNIERGLEILEEVQSDRWTPLGVALLERERGMTLIEVNPNKSVQSFERAWAASGHDEAAWLRSGIGEVLGWALLTVGRINLAQQYLEIALDGALGARRSSILLHMGLCDVYMGNFDLAKARFDTVRIVPDLPEPRRLELQILDAHLAMHMGLLEDAAGGYLEAAALARDLHMTELEFVAEITLAEIALMRDHLEIGRAHLSRARNVVGESSPRLLAYLAWQYGNLMTRAADPNAAQALQDAMDAFERLGLEREVGLTALHLAEANFRASLEEAGLMALRRAVDARHASRARGAFGVEIRSLPHVFEVVSLAKPGQFAHVLLEDWRALEVQGASVLTVKTLGGVGLSLDGRALHVTSGLARTVAVLAFMLEKREHTLEEVQLNVFDGDYPENARAAFHTIRAFLRTGMSNISIPFNSRSRTYSLEHPGLRVVWDAQEVRSALNLKTEGGLRRALALYTGPFLPRMDGDWATEFRISLEWEVSMTGRAVVEDLFARERWDACIALARGLFEINSSDAAMAVLLVRATAFRDGHSAAWQEFGVLSERLRHALGEVPEVLLEAARSFNMTN